MAIPESKKMLTIEITSRPFHASDNCETPWKRQGFPICSGGGEREQSLKWVNDFLDVM